MSAVPLVVTSRRLPASEQTQTVAQLLRYADPHNPLVWVQSHAAAVGIGAAVTLQAAGPERFTQLQTQWEQLVAAAQISDEVQVPGSGLVAFGTIAYGDDSSSTSLLVVPEIIVQRHHDEFFITTVQRATAGQIPQPLPPLTATALDFATWRGCDLRPVGTTAQQQEYRTAAATLLQEITAGNVQKAVLSRQISAEISVTADLRIPLSRLAQQYSECAVFAIDGFLGASPETLARTIQGSVRTRVLAGTAPRDTTDATADAAAGDSLLHSAQITAEHEFAAASVIDALTPLVTELDTNTKPLVIGLPNVWHRATDINAKISGEISCLDLVAAMHPTAAVAGTPTTAAVPLLQRVESFDRGRYAGAVGWISAAGDGEWALALRCAQVSPLPGDPEAIMREDGSTTANGSANSAASSAATRTVTATAGGGLVAGSEITAEYAETVAKFAPIVAAFAP
ncbi:isochorismate synthase [Leucobacter sp. OH2974_COT-288]|nr:isochorismate synthase [Leucobacter sp. OH2974_COT-288]